MTLTSLFVFACALFVAAGSPGPSSIPLSYPLGEHLSHGPPGLRR